MRKALIGSALQSEAFSKCYETVQNTEGYRKKLEKYDHDNYETNAGIGIVLEVGGAGSVLGNIISEARGAEGSMSLNITGVIIGLAGLSQGSANESFQERGKDETPAELLNRQYEAAGKFAHALSEGFHLSQVEEIKVKEAILASAAASTNKTPVDVIGTLQKIKSHGQPLFKEEELTSLRRLTDNTQFTDDTQSSPGKKEEMDSDRSKIGYLQAFNSFLSFCQDNKYLAADNFNRTKDVVSENKLVLNRIKDFQQLKRLEKLEASGETPHQETTAQEDATGK